MLEDCEMMRDGGAIASGYVSSSVEVLYVEAGDSAFIAGSSSQPA
jgi:hypothetical protein